MVGELRACNVISTNKAKAIVYGDIATATTAITKAPIIITFKGV